MAELRQCAIETCRVKLAESNRGTMCFRCTEKHGRKVPTGSGLSETRGVRRGPVRAPSPEPVLVAGVEMCPRGCGYTRHGGRCKGQKVAPKMPQAFPAAIDQEPAKEAGQVFTEKGARRMDRLISKTIRMEEVPLDAGTEAKAQGRVGVLWAKLQTLKPGEAEQVESRDRKHAGDTLSHIRRKAKAIGREVGGKRLGSKLYLWLLPRAE